MKHLLIAVVAVAALIGCASDPARRAAVATEESSRLAAPTTPLSSYGTFELKPMEMSPTVANDAAKVEAVKDLEGRVQARVQPLLAQWNAQGAKSTAAGTTLIVQPRVTSLRVVSGGARFFAGALAGESSVAMVLELKDAATGAVIANPRIERAAGAMAGAWSIGATDRNLMDYIAEIAGQYLQDNRK
jgi:curli biogenesis system outer membrane secretion channel CsgG